MKPKVSDVVDFIANSPKTRGMSVFRKALKRSDWRGYIVLKNWLIKVWVEFPLEVDISLVSPKEIEFVCPYY